MHPSSAPAERGGGLVTTATAAAASSTAAKNKGRGAPTLLGASLLHLPRGTPIVVETREDLVFRGGLEWADEKMNLVLSQCECENVSTGEKWSDAQVSVRDRAVRSVVLPPDFDPVQTLLELGALVEHVILRTKSETFDSLSAAMCAHLPGLSVPFAKKLVAFGAVHVSEIPPLLKGNRASHSDALQTFREDLIRERGIKEPTHRRYAVTRCTEDDRAVGYGTYIRVHVHPRRFPLAHSVSWEDRVLREEEDYVVIDKPGGVPTVPTVDNLYENCLHMTGRAIEARGPLRVTHRLDQPTSGVLVLAKTKDFCSHFNQLLSERGEREDPRVTKVYRVLTERAVPRGVLSESGGALTHYAEIGVRSKGRPTRTVVHDRADGPGGNGKRVVCKLRVLRCDGVAGTGMYESEVVLLTGRTHQIRAQFAHIGCPVAGDPIYNGGSGEAEEEEVRVAPERIGLRAARVTVRDDSGAGFFPQSEGVVFEVKSCDWGWWGE